MTSPEIHAALDMLDAATVAESDAKRAWRSNRSPETEAAYMTALDAGDRAAAKLEKLVARDRRRAHRCF